MRAPNKDEVVHECVAQAEVESREGLIASWTTAFGFDSSLYSRNPENCYDAIAVGVPYCLAFVSQGESRPWIVQLGGEAESCRYLWRCTSFWQREAR